MAHLHLHVSLHQAVHAVYGPPEAAEQDDDQHHDDQRRKPPAQQEVKQVAALRVLVVHHQHLPEVHGLGGRGRRTGREAVRSEGNFVRANPIQGTVAFNVSTQSHFYCTMTALFALTCDGGFDSPLSLTCCALRVT